MSTFKLKHLLASAAMLAAAAGAVALKPSIRMADQRPINLEQMIPQQFGDWKLDQSVMPVQPNPDLQRRLNKIYSQVMARTYINPQGERVMLSISYGEDQSKETGLHRPETCYPAQGFAMLVKGRDQIVLPDGKRLPVSKLITQKNERIEPVIYWMKVGEFIAATGFEQKIAVVRQQLHGVIPDGLLFRVSSINAEPAHAFALQQRFINDLIISAGPQTQRQLVGSALH